MTEAATTATPSGASAPAAAEPVVSNVSQYIGEDGSFKEGWRDNLVPEDLRHEKVYDALPNVAESLKMLGNLQRVIGKKGLIQPTESSTPSEWDVFYKALGRPDKPDAYKIDIAKDLVDRYNPEMVNQAKEMFHKLGLNQKQAEELFKFDQERLTIGLKMIEQQKEQQRIDAETQLKKELGAEYDNYIHIGNRIISENIPEGEQREKFLNKFGSDPDFIKFVGTVGKKFTEAGGIPSATEKSTGMSVSEATAKMQEVAKTLADTTLVYNNPGLHARLTKEMEGLAKLVSQK